MNDAKRILHAKSAVGLAVRTGTPDDVVRARAGLAFAKCLREFRASVDAGWEINHLADALVNAIVEEQ